MGHRDCDDHNPSWHGKDDGERDWEAHPKSQSVLNSNSQSCHDDGIPHYQEVRVGESSHAGPELLGTEETHDDVAVILADLEHFVRF
ncbi:hypothetical protein V7S43_005808 [Phytophthora oleae]|uniref:Guanylate cyclase domain-containing protein n=1 Tax=Phytophthora oleae TaxID=2107226 RepID=A0ABD3FUY7_9STRA